MPASPRTAAPASASRTSPRVPSPPPTPAPRRPVQRSRTGRVRGSTRSATCSISDRMDSTQNRAPLGAERTDQLADLDDARRNEAVRRLVEDQHRRALSQRRRDARRCTSPSEYVFTRARRPAAVRPSDPLSATSTRADPAREDLEVPPAREPGEHRGLIPRSSRPEPTSRPAPRDFGIHQPGRPPLARTSPSRHRIDGGLAGVSAPGTRTRPPRARRDQAGRPPRSCPPRILRILLTEPPRPRYQRPSVARIPSAPRRATEQGGARGFDLPRRPAQARTWTVRVCQELRHGPGPASIAQTSVPPRFALEQHHRTATGQG